MTKEIELSQFKGKPLNLGGVISIIIEELFDMENLPKSEILLQICNEIMHGNYIIPSAIGFSTPLHILGDLKKAKLIVNNNKHESNSINSFLDWKQNYNTKLYKIKPIVFEQSSDKDMCSICLEKYKLGDQICKLQLCGHQFHKSCISTMDSRITCPMCRNHAVLHPLTRLNDTERVNIYVNELAFN